MQFRDREDVAWQLAERLAPYLGQGSLVLGLPRGGVPMAAVIAERLDADLDVMLVHKLRAAFQPELALGSIDEAGHVYLTPFADELGVDERELGDEAQFQLGALRNRRARYTSGAPRASMTDRTVILVDDGLATGSTAIAAVRSARAQGAARVVVAAGVAPAATVSRSSVCMRRRTSTRSASFSGIFPRSATTRSCGCSRGGLAVPSRQPAEALTTRRSRSRRTGSTLPTRTRSGF
jgi:predicted phosphoribosyltransferase